MPCSCGGIAISSKKTRINEDIRTPEVRLIDAEGNQLGVVATVEALRKARDSELDLVEVSPTARPPVARIMDFNKWQYQQSKKKNKSKQVQVKEIKLRPVTDQGDLGVKLRNLKRFIEHGDKVKVTVRFRGREIAHHELGLALLDRVKHEIAEFAIVEQTPNMEGRQLVMIVGPKRKN